jgi:putative ABC transport system permease protein
MELKKSQINYIIADLHRRGLVYQPLEEELLDHVCTMVEEKMESGMRFMEAYQAALALFGNEQEIENIQQQTLFNTYSNTMAMINNYFKISFRNLKKHKFYSVINIAGLSIGLTCTILITLFVRDELSYDRHHLKADQIYRVANHLRFGGNDSHYAVSPAPLAAALMAEIPEVESATRFRQWGDFLVKKETENFNENNVVWADPQVFKVFTIPLISGNPDQVLTEPNTMMISESIARKYFGETDPVNQTLILNNSMNYKITGVFKDMPANSHFHFNIMLAMAGLEESKNQVWLSSNFQTYFVMNKEADPMAIEKKINKLYIKYAGPQIQQIMGKTFEELVNEGARAELYLQPLLDIHLKSDLWVEFEPNGDIKYVYIFSAIALFILILAIVNFMNLATARSADRAKEVGIRKVLGSLRSYLIRQFLTESVLITSISVLVALLLVYGLLPYFNVLAQKSISFPWENPPFWVAIVVLAILIGILAGIYPAIFLSAFKPGTILRGRISKGARSSIVRSILVVFQFAISIILLIGTAAVYNQLNYIQNKKLGFNKEQVIIVDDAYVLDNQINSFRDEMVRDPMIQSGTISGFYPVSNSSRSNNTFWTKGKMTMENSVNMQVWMVDEDYLSTLGMEMVKGRFFSREFPSDSSGMVLNEQAARLFGFEDPVGPEIQTFEYQPDNSLNEDKLDTYHVIGIVKDFHFESLRENIGALCMLLGPSTGKISFRFNAAQTSAVIDLIKKKWDEMVVGQPFQYSFLDQDFGDMYAAEKKISQIFTTFALLAVIIASLGLFALAAFMAEQRTKEIGIRKVMGATMGNIIFLLSKDFSKLVFIAFIISIPVAWYGIRIWLEGFAYKDIPGVFVYLGAGMTALVIAWLTVSYQSIRAASTNPAQSLRDE